MSHCDVKGCHNGRRVKDSTKEEYTLHRLPADPNIRMLWLSSCNLEDRVNCKDNRRICDRHFEIGDYITDAKGRRKLIDRAVPSQCLPDTLPQHHYTIKLPDCRKKHSSYFVVKLQNGTILKITFDVPNKLSAHPILLHAYTENCDFQPERPTNNSFLTNRLAKGNKRLREIIKKCRKAKAVKIKKDKQKRIRETNQCKLLKNRVTLLTEQLRTKSKMCEIEKTNMLENFAYIFTPMQMKVILTKQKKPRWTEIDIARGIALRAKSNGCYQFVRDVFNIPLPGISTIKRYCQKIDMRPGIQQSVLNLLREEFSSLSELKRHAIFSFDEMAIDSSACYDSHEDKIYGQQKYLSLGIIRAQCGKWKQPVYFSYEQMTVETIYSVIKQCYSVGVIVKGFVCDLGGTNRGLLNKLGISINKTYIIHPITSEKVWYSPDGPHLIKLLRNNLVDYGFTLSCKEKIDRRDLEMLINADSNEFRMQHKLTDYHLNLKGRERQRVRAACQLLSGTTSVAFLQLFPEKKAIAEFIQLVNDCFDIMNSRDPQESNAKKAAYGLHLKEQDEILEKMYFEMLHMRVNSKNTKSLFPFQKGYLIAITSLKGLYQDLKTKFGINYILTHRFNQDVLENAFSVIRANGATSETPNAVDAKYRVKSLLLGWTFGKIKTAPVEMEEDNPFLSYKLLSPLMVNLRENEESVDEDVFEELSLPDVDPVNSDNWTDKVNSMSNKEKCDFYGKEYVCGYILRKLEQSHPHMLLTSEDRNPPSFTENVSRGSLSIPSYDFLNLFLEFEEVFLHMFHEKGDKYGLFRGNNVLKTLTHKLKQMYPSVSENIITLYSRTRIHIRIKYVNKQLNSKKLQRRNKIVHFLRSHVPDAENVEEIESQLMNETEMLEDWNAMFGVSESDMLGDYKGLGGEMIELQD